MEIKIAVCNVALDNKIRKIKIEVDETATIQQMLNNIGTPIADVLEYYEFSGVFLWNSPYLPYIISDDKICYDVGFSEAKVIDFLKTHNISNNELYIKTGYAQAGGAGVIELELIWEQVYPVLDEIATLLSLGVSAVGLIKWFCSLFKKRKRTPQVCFDIIFSRQCWNHFELAGLLDIENDKAKQLLQLFDYKYNNKTMLYQQGKNSKEIKKRLSKIKVLDI